MIDEKKLATDIEQHIISLVNDTDISDLPMTMGSIVTLAGILVNIIRGEYDVDPPKSCFDCKYCGTKFENHFYCCKKNSSLHNSNALKPCSNWVKND